MGGILVGHTVLHKGFGIGGRIVEDDDMVAVLRPVLIGHELSIAFCRDTYLKVVRAAVEHAVAHDDILRTQGLIMVITICHIINHVYMLQIGTPLKGSVGQDKTYLGGIVAGPTAAQVGEGYRLDVGVVAEGEGIHGNRLVVVVGSDVVIDGHLALVVIKLIIIHAGNLHIPHFLAAGIERVGGEDVAHVEHTVTGAQRDIVFAEGLVMFVGVVFGIGAALTVLDVLAEHGEIVVLHSLYLINVVAGGVRNDMVGILCPVGIALESRQLVGTHAEVNALVGFDDVFGRHHLRGFQSLYGVASRKLVIHQVYRAQVLAPDKGSLLYHDLERVVGLAHGRVTVSETNLAHIRIALEGQGVDHHRLVVVDRSNVIIDSHLSPMFPQIMVAHAVHMRVIDRRPLCRAKELIDIQTDKVAGMGTQLVRQDGIMPVGGTAKVCILQLLSARSFQETLIGNALLIGIFPCHLLPCHDAVGIILPLVMVLKFLHLVGPYTDIRIVRPYQHRGVFGCHLIGREGSIAIATLVAIYKVDGLEVGAVGKGLAADGEARRGIGAARHGVVEPYGTQVTIPLESLRPDACGAVGIGSAGVIV